MMKAHQFKTYLFSYQYEGASYVVEVKATGQEDAKMRMNCIRHATFDGEVAVKITMPSLMERLIARALRVLIKIIPQRSAS